MLGMHGRLHLFGSGIEDLDIKISGRQAIGGEHFARASLIGDNDKNRAFVGFDDISGP